jgi:hypothetical protein
MAADEHKWPRVRTAREDSHLHLLRSDKSVEVLESNSVCLVHRESKVVKIFGRCALDCCTEVEDESDMYAMTEGARQIPTVVLQVHCGHEVGVEVGNRQLVARIRETRKHDHSDDSDSKGTQERPVITRGRPPPTVDR